MDKMNRTMRPGLWVMTIALAVFTVFVVLATGCTHGQVAPRSVPTGDRWHSLKP